MIILRVDINGSIDPHPEFVADIKELGQTPQERETLAHWVRALDHPEGTRRLRQALREECRRKGISVA